MNTLGDTSSLFSFPQDQNQHDGGRVLVLAAGGGGFVSARNLLPPGVDRLWVVGLQQRAENVEAPGAELGPEADPHPKRDRDAGHRGRLHQLPASGQGCSGHVSTDHGRRSHL